MKKVVMSFLFFSIFLLNINAESIKEEAVFVSCTDGDTFKVEINDNTESVRLLAVDTPETVKPGTPVEPYGKEASDYTCDKIKNAKKIELEYDNGSDKKDKYNRLLAWVYVDDSMLQKELISLGYANVAYIYGDYKYTDDLYELEKEAATDKRGIWTDEEYKTEEKSEKVEEEKTFWQEVEDLIEKRIQKWLKKVVISIKNSINKAIKSIFD